MERIREFFLGLWRRVQMKEEDTVIDQGNSEGKVWRQESARQVQGTTGEHAQCMKRGGED